MSVADNEALSRLRRIETRLTQLMVGLGIDTRTQKPMFDPSKSRVVVPSMHSSIQEITAAIPKDWTKPVELRIGGTCVGTLSVGGH